MTTLDLHPDRLFPADPGLARARAPLYATVATCRSSARTATPIRSGTPTTRRSPNASALFITPDHYVFRMLYSQGVPLEDARHPAPRRRAGRDPTRARSGARFAAH